MKAQEKTVTQQRANSSSAHTVSSKALQKKAVGVVQKVEPEEEVQQHQSDKPAQKVEAPELDEEHPAGVTQHKHQPTEVKDVPAHGQENNTGMPDSLKSGIEHLSGMSMDHVKVHYNSSQPAQLQALAYAQGSDIHIGPGQEQHLPHEAWHVVQQAQGRVQPTTQMKGGVAVNDDPGLEHEADVMGAKAMASGKAIVQRKSRKTGHNYVNGNLTQLRSSGLSVVQREIRSGAFNMVGESHNEANRIKEKDYLKKQYGIPPQNYWTELEFQIQEKNYKNVQKRADPPIAHVRQQLLGLADGMSTMQLEAILNSDITTKMRSRNELIGSYWNSAFYGFINLFSPEASTVDKQKADGFALEQEEEKRMLEAYKLAKPLELAVAEMYNWIKGEDFFLTKKRRMNAIASSAEKLESAFLNIDAKMAGLGSSAPTNDAREKSVADERDTAMLYGAWQAGLSGKTGVWKVGNNHISGLLPFKNGFLLGGSNVTLTTKEEFNSELNK